MCTPRYVRGGCSVEGAETLSQSGRDQPSAAELREQQLRAEHAGDRP
jgi:hypothetical protein